MSRGTYFETTYIDNYYERLEWTINNAYADCYVCSL